MSALCSESHSEAGAASVVPADLVATSDATRLVAGAAPPGAHPGAALQLCAGGRFIRNTGGALGDTRYASYVTKP
jgi:hypothetical protein